MSKITKEGIRYKGEEGVGLVSSVMIRDYFFEANNK